MRRLATNLLLLILPFVPGVASAASWLDDRDKREGLGIPLGDSLVMHPGVGVEGGYDTNPLRQSDPEGAGRLKIAPYLDLLSRGYQDEYRPVDDAEEVRPKFNLKLGLAGIGNFYFNGGNTAAAKTVDNQDHLGAETKLSFMLYPGGTFSFLADALYRRTVEPYESAADHWASHYINPGIGFIVRPGGGTLSFEAGYRLLMLLYEDDAIAERNDKMSHQLRLVTAWRIFPKTALMSKLTFEPIFYLGDRTPNLDSRPVRAKFGIQGLLTNRFGLSLFVGYGVGFYQPPPGQSTTDDFDGIIGDAQVMFYILPTANIKVGGQRDFVDSFYSNYYTKTGCYVSYEQMFGGMFLATLKGDLFYRQYSTLQGEITNGYTASEGKRTETWLSASLLLELRLAKFVSLHASATYQQNLSGFEYISVAEAGQNSIGVDFQRFEALGGVRLYY